MSALMYGPRRVNERGIVCLPRPLLTRTGLTGPRSVDVHVDTSSRAQVRITAVGNSRPGGSQRASLTSVGQLSLPRQAARWLDLGSDRLVYAHAADDVAEICLVAARVALTVPTGEESPA